MATRKCVLGKVSDDTKRCQTAQVHGLAGELLDGVELLHPYGLSTVPLAIDKDGKGAESLLVDVNGSSVRVALAPQDRRYRPRGGSNPGDVVLYHYSDDPEAADPQSATARASFTNDGDPEGPTRFILRVGGATIEVIGGAGGVPPKIFIDTTSAAIALVDDEITVTAKSVTVNASGDVSVKADGSATIEAASVEIKAASISLGA